MGLQLTWPWHSARQALPNSSPPGLQTTGAQIRGQIQSGSGGGVSLGGGVMLVSTLLPPRSASPAEAEIIIDATTMQ